MVDAVVRIFESTATSFETNGIGYLPDVITCEVTEKRNGEFELVMKYPTTGVRYSELELRKLLVVKSNPYSDPQPFRIYEITKPIKLVVTVYAEHISYDMSGIPVGTFEATRVDEALNGLKSHSVVPCPFFFFTDKNTSSNFKISIPQSMKSSLGGVDGSILDVYGGEYEFNVYRVNLWNHRGMNRGVTIRYGKNLTNLEQEENCANVYTGVYPYWTSEEEGLVELPEKIVNTPGTFDYTRILMLDLSYEWDEPPTEEQLRARAERYIKENDIGIPKVSIEVSFIDLASCKEFELSALLQTVHLCDTVTVEFEELGVKATAKCIETVYDATTDRYISLSLGDAKANFATTISDNNDKMAESFDKILDSELTSLKKENNKELDETADALRKETDDKLAAAEESVNQRFVQVNDRFAILDGVIVDLDTDIGKKLESIGQNIDDIDGDISNLFAGMTAVNGEINDINKDIQNIDGDISGLQSSVTALDQELKTGLATEATNRELAITNATKKITGNHGGYVILHSSTNADYPDEILIMDTQDIKTAKKIWRWNQAGLGYSKTGYNGPYELAMTQNGVIVADFIQAGVMSADRIKGGTLILGGGNNGNGSFSLLDQNNNVIGVMNNAGIQMLKGQIKGPSIMAGGAANGNGIISVFDENNNVVGLMNNAGLQILKGEIKGPYIQLGGIANESGYMEVLNANREIIGKWNKDGLYAENAYIRGDVKSTIADEGGDDYVATMGTIKIVRIVGTGQPQEYETYGFQVNEGVALTQDGLYGSQRIGFQTLLNNGGTRWFEMLMDTSVTNYHFSMYYRDGRSSYPFIQMSPNTDGNTLLLQGTPVAFAGGDGKEVFFKTITSTSIAGNAVLVYWANKGYRIYMGSSSSIRYKEVLRDMVAEDVKELYNIQPVMAKYKDDYLADVDERHGKYYPMFIAENIEKYCPEAVDHNEDGTAEKWNANVMIPIMFQMLKDQKKEIDMLKMEIEKLKAEKEV